MSKKSTSDPYSKLFRSAGTVLKSKVPGNSLELASKKPFLHLPEPLEASDEQKQEAWRGLRKFFLTGQKGSIPEGFRSIHMDPELLSIEHLENFPLLIFKNEDKTISVLPILQWLNELIHGCFPSESEGVILKKTVPALFNNLVKNTDRYHDDFENVWKNSVSAYAQQLELKGAEKKDFEASMETLEAGLPKYGKIIPFNSNIIFPVLGAALADRNIKRKAALAQKVDIILPFLTELLEVEKENEPEAIAPEHLKSSLSFAGHYFNFEKLSNVLPESSSEHLSADRHNRIKDVIYSLEKGKTLLNHRGTLFIQKDLLPNIDWEELFEGFEIQIVPKGELCQATSEYFEAHISEYSKVIKSLRIGLLEKENKYVPSYHDQLFESFNWKFIQAEEMDLIAPLVLIADSETLAREEIAMMSRILSSDMPVNMIGLKFDDKKAPDTMLDPGSLAIAHRNTFVSQLSSLNPLYMFDRVKEGLSAFSPSFFQIRTVREPSGKRGIDELHASLEGREFPVFTYNGHVGTPWGSRFDVSENPSVDHSWPEYDYTFLNNDEEKSLTASFTYAEYLVLKEENHELFSHVEVQYWTDQLIPLSSYLKFKGDERYGSLPFIWMVDEKNTLQKLIVSWELVSKCMQVQDFWQYLQDSGGVRNYHVQEALEKQEASLREEWSKEISNLKEEHANEIESVRKESTEQAMDHLTAALLDLDSDSLISESAEPKKQVSDIVEEDVEAAGALEEVPEQEEAISEEPWIETPLCTNCNECTDINNRMFKYNQDKLAYLADPKAGSFAQLVEAAEKCPVHIIHPGKPLNPSEPGLEDLIKRAEKFN